MYQMDGGNDLRRDSQNCHCDVVMQLHMCVWTRQIKIQLRHTTIFLKKLFKSIISLIILVKSITWMRVIFHLTHVPVIAKRGQKKVCYRVSGKKEQITILGCANAIGQALPPMVIFDGKYLNYQWTTDEVPGTYYGMSRKEWTDQVLFKHWFQDHFLKYAVPTRPLLLLMDGYCSHYEPSSVELAKNNDAILFCLPPHTTQDSQPLDCTVFGPPKRNWSTVCHEFLHNHPGVVINKYNFSGLFAKAWLLALTLANIVSGFKKCGIYTFNRNAIVIPLLTEIVRQTIHKKTLVLTMITIPAVTRGIKIHKKTMVPIQMLTSVI